MRAERRGRVILACGLVNRGDVGGAGERAKPWWQAVCDFQTAGLGGVAEGEGQPGGRGCRRGVDPGVRGEPAGNLYKLWNVRHECERRVIGRRSRDRSNALREMGDRWPSGVVLWEAVPNHHMLRWLKTVVVSDVEKAHVMRQVGARETTAVDMSRSESDIGTGFGSRPGMSLAGTHVLVRRCPAQRRREPRLRLSQGTWEGEHGHRLGSDGRARGSVPRAETGGTEYRRRARWRTVP